jgi:hypothetical protein
MSLYTLCTRVCHILESSFDSALSRIVRSHVAEIDVVLDEAMIDIDPREPLVAACFLAGMTRIGMNVPDDLLLFRMSPLRLFH